MDVADAENSTCGCAAVSPSKPLQGGLRSHTSPATSTRFSVLRMLLMFLALAFMTPAKAQEAPDAVVTRLSNDVLGAIKSNQAIRSGDLQRLVQLVDTKVIPQVDVQRMTASALGRYWPQATPEQKIQLQEQFKLLLIRSYSGALSQVHDETVRVKPMRGGSSADTDVIVRTEVRGDGEPIELDYRMEKSGGTWKIYDVAVLGVWLAENYRNTFADEIESSSIQALIAKLADRNKAVERTRPS